MDQSTYASAVQKYIDRSLSMDVNSVSGPLFRTCPVFSVAADPRGTKSSSTYFVLLGKSNTPDLSYAINSRSTRVRPHSISMDLPLKTNVFRKITFWIRPGAVLLPRSGRMNPSLVAVGCSCPDYEYNGQKAKTRDRGNMLGCKHMMLVNKKLGHDIVPTPARPYQALKKKLRLELVDDGFND